MAIFEFFRNVFGFSQTASRKTNSEVINSEGDTVIDFEVDAAGIYEIEHCRLGDGVDLWIPEDDRSVIMIYKNENRIRGGYIGRVPEQFIKIISKHITNGFLYSAHISVLKDTCSIQCILRNKDITLSQRENERSILANKLEKELLRKYRPRKKNIDITVLASKKHNLKLWQKIYLREQSISYYLEHANNLTITFLDENENEVAEKRSAPEQIKAILRAQFCSIEMNFRVKKLLSGNEMVVEVTYSLIKGELN